MPFIVALPRQSWYLHRPRRGSRPGQPGPPAGWGGPLGAAPFRLPPRFGCLPARRV